MKIKALDLKKKFPRSPALRLGGFVILARTADKCRAVIAGTEGEYKFNCPLDQHFFKFTKINANEFRKLVASGAGDAEIASWVKKKTAKLKEEKVAAWNFDMIHREPKAADEKAFFDSYCSKYSPDQPYLSSWFQMLDAEEGRL